MHTRTVIKWMHGLLTIFLLILVGGFIYLNHTSDSRSGDELQHSYKINDRLWLYTTINREGNATVPIIYRFYLAGEIIGNNKVIIKKLNDEIPFLTGNGSISSINTTDNENINVVYSGKIYSLNNTISYSIDNHQVNAHISFCIN
ncbi:hypothetical protein PMPD1_1892 [Paramixta manurensis]|uniref:Uncharacterized protein n=1 Tax=Paramixta manurensis TaxID=2740817 RepID=A0A6M8UJ29_9GAMM|nr:hypothetical protein PMPD1_1892 [Erwiniaceae bacterium PD-1]